MEHNRTADQRLEINSILTMTHTVQAMQADLVQKLQTAIDESERLLKRLGEPVHLPERSGEPGMYSRHA